MSSVKYILGSKVLLIDNFLDVEECNVYINQINEKKDIINFTNEGKFKNDKYIDPDLSMLFYNRIGYDVINKLNVVKPNNLIMTGKYEVGQSFSLHTDTGLYFNLEQKLKSTYTMLIYLNDDFEGGHTLFYDDKFNHLFNIIPKKGMALIFDIDMWHSGQQLSSGTKYWIGCELIGKFRL